MFLDQQRDPDYFYHMALSREMSTSGFVDSIPQIKGIGWDILFTDKEFLFHVLTSIAYKIGREPAIEYLMLLLFITLVSSLVYYARKKVSWAWAPVCLLPLIADPHFLSRMTLVRPHVLAVLIFTWIMILIQERKPKLLLAAGAIFSLSYHGLQMPGLLIFCALLAQWLCQQNRSKELWYLTAGLFVGVIINPYFPGNLVMFEIVTRIFFDAQQSQTSLPFGVELYTWNSLSILKVSVISLTILISGLYFWSSQKKEDRSFALLFPLLTTGILLALCSVSPRGREYLVPSLVILLVALRTTTPKDFFSWRKSFFPVVLTGAFLVQSFLLRHDYSILPKKEHKEIQAIQSALMAIPSKGGHVLNCNWSQSPYIYYFRPDLSFIDILDPSFLYRAEPNLHKLRERFYEGKEVDPYPIVKYGFQAQYTLCDIPELNAKLDADPRFERIFPKNPNTTQSAGVRERVFRLKDDATYFVRNYEYQIQDIKSLKQMQGLTKPPTDSWQSFSLADKTRKPAIQDYFNFTTLLPLDLSIQDQQLRSNSLQCVWVRPQISDVQKSQSAQFLGIGGALNIRVWLNGQNLFQSRGEEFRGRMIDLLIPIGSLKSQDRLEALICPSPQAPFFGIALSFWQKPQINKICEEKLSDLRFDVSVPLQWKYWGATSRTCLAPIANNQFIQK